MRISKEYLNALTCKFYTFSRQNLQTFDISHAFLSLTFAKLSTLKNGSVFWLTLYCSLASFLTLVFHKVQCSDVFRVRWDP